MNSKKWKLLKTEEKNEQGLTTSCRLNCLNVCPEVEEKMGKENKEIMVKRFPDVVKNTNFRSSISVNHKQYKNN